MRVELVEVKHKRKAFACLHSQLPSFVLIEKKQKIKPEKTFRPRAKHPGPVFRQGLYPLLFCC